jgi:crotonobetainyl-CoA:carnitine CoA-transferase CaiB-like acyl-CoA transferase
VLDLKQPAAYAALSKLLARADVMIWNNRPPSMARMKLGYDDVRAINPRTAKGAPSRSRCSRTW